VGESILIVGASGRAAAFSALRAGLTPHVIDLFSDQDLRAAAEVHRISGRDYPHGLVSLARQYPPMPWIYTGGLENHSDIVGAIAAERPLGGNGPAVLAKVRDPFALAAALEKAGLPHPPVRRADDPPRDGRWLVKPLRGSGGAGIRFAPDRHHRAAAYFQEFVEGESRAAIFRDGELLGVTQQLVGEHWLHAPKFGYCGSIGPLALSDRESAKWQQLGEFLVRWASIRGIFGVDAIVRDGLPWLIEVNPRYTASVEVIEYASARNALTPIPSPAKPGEGCKSLGRTGAKPGEGMGVRAVALAKAIYYAPQAIEFPSAGPWEDSLAAPNVNKMPEYADIPGAGTTIRRGRPVLTVFGRDEVELRNKARMLDSLFAERQSP
jgi:uncharacterized protein